MSYRKKTNKTLSALNGTGMILVMLFITQGCSPLGKHDFLQPKITLVNSPNDIVTLGAEFLAREIEARSQGEIKPKVYSSGVLSGGKGSAEIEMCQEGSIQIHITTTAYLANLVPRASIVSLPFLFRDIDQVIGLAKSKSQALETINRELNTKNLNIIAWWPRGFRQLTNSKRPVRKLGDIRGLNIRVMNNQLFVDNLNVMGANPVPMDWGEVYNCLQLYIIDGQENGEDVIYNSRIYEVQKYMTLWDYSTDIEVVIVNFAWWNEITPDQRNLIRQVADSSVDFQVGLLKNNIRELRGKIAGNGIQIDSLSPEEKKHFREAVQPVWDKYQEKFTISFLDSFLAEIKKY